MLRWWHGVHDLVSFDLASFQQSLDLMAHVENNGGSVACIESGYFRKEIGRAAYEYQKSIESKERALVGVNKFVSEQSEIPQVLKVDPALEKRQVQRLQALKEKRDNAKVSRSLTKLKEAAEGNDNIVNHVVEAVENYATVGEISNQLREVWGEYHETN